jgi:hypothetical protein
LSFILLSASIARIGFAILVGNTRLIKESLTIDVLNVPRISKKQENYINLSWRVYFN